MSSVIPTRRTLRTTRATVAKDTENANARPSRISTRAKPLSNSSTTLPVKSKTSGDLKDQPAGKRKREALSEVTAQVANHRLGLGVKGKEKEKEVAAKKFDGVVLNKSKTVVSGQPLRTVASTRPKPIPAPPESTLEDITEESVALTSHDDNAMVIDPPAPLHSLTIRKSLVNIEQVTLLPGTRRSGPGAHRTRLGRKDDAGEDGETGRVFKKRRTSSEAPEDLPQEAEQARLHVEHDMAAHVDDGAHAIEEEADPLGDSWEDLDAEDAEDPLMVSEYVNDIFEYLKKVESTTMPNASYMTHQKDLGWSMRGILADWLIELHTRMRFLPETLFLCMNIIDRFLSNRLVSLAKLQLVGVTALFIAAKVEEITTPAAINFVNEADGVYTELDMFKAERYVLKTLDWNLSFPNPIHYLRRISKADQYNVAVRTMAKYLLEIGCVEWRLIAAPPSLMAAAAMWLARLMLGRGPWDVNLAHYSGYSESTILPTANLMLNYLLKPLRHEVFNKKYAMKKHLKVSTFARQWVRDLWAENTQVNLERQLTELKEKFWIPQEDHEGMEDHYTS